MQRLFNGWLRPRGSRRWRLVCTADSRPVVWAALNGAKAPIGSLRCVLSDTEGHPDSALAVNEGVRERHTVRTRRLRGYHRI
jgi:hypothetical protein